MATVIFLLTDDRTPCICSTQCTFFSLGSIFCSPGLQFRKSLPGVSAARLGMPLSMACETINTDSNGMQTSNLSREMTWYRDGSPIANQTSGTQAPDTFNFSIEHVRVKDQGQYTCLVSSANTTISMATYLFVFGKKMILIILGK